MKQFSDNDEAREIRAQERTIFCASFKAAANEQELMVKPLQGGSVLKALDGSGVFGMQEFSCDDACLLCLLLDRFD